MRTQSRFARSLSQYLSTHSQVELADACKVERSIISRIANGRRPPTQEAARSIISALSGPDRIDMLRAWLEDQIPDNCTGLVRIIAAAGPVDLAPGPFTEQERALAWLRHQLDTNVHAVHAIVDLWRASGSPDAPADLTPTLTTMQDPAIYTAGDEDLIAARVADEPLPPRPSVA